MKKRLEILDLLKAVSSNVDPVMLGRGENYEAITRITQNLELGLLIFTKEDESEFTLEICDIFAIYVDGGVIHIELNDESEWLIDTAFLSLNSFLEKCKKSKSAEVVFSDKTAEFTATFENVKVDDPDDMPSITGARKINVSFFTHAKNGIDSNSFSLKLFDPLSRFQIVERTSYAFRVRVLMHDLSRAYCEIAFR